MKFQKDNTANRLTAEVLTERREAEENKRRLKEAQDEVNAQRAEERRRAHEAMQPHYERAAAYPEIKDQLDMLWHDIDNGTIAMDKGAPDTWYQKIKTIKEETPLPSSPTN